MPSGDEAAHRALSAIRDEFLGKPAVDCTGAVVSGIDAANRAVLDLRVGAGTTLTVVTIVAGEARVFHVGDSTAMIVGQRGVIRFLSTAHSPTGFGIEAGLMTEAEALAHEDRNLVLNVVGSAEMSVEISQPVRLKARDTVLLASDGLSDNLTVESIAALCRVGPCEDAVRSLARAAGRRMHDEDGHPDDLTILAYRPTAHRRR